MAGVQMAEIEATTRVPGSGTGRTLSDVLAHAAASCPDAPLLRRENPRQPAEVSYSRFDADVDALALALLERVPEPGTRVALFADNCRAWLLCDQAIARAGLVSVPRGTDSSPAELRTIVEHSGARIVLLGRQLDLGLPGPGDRDADPNDISVVDLHQELDSWLARGRVLAASTDAGERLARARPQPDDLCTIVYTSGTTGNPKGVMLTHANLVSNIDAVNATLTFPGRGTMLSILPSWHMFERVFEYVSISRCCCIVYTDTRRLTADLAEYRPDIVAFVPRIWELIAAGMQKKLEALPARKQRVVAAVRRIGRRALRTPRGSALRRFHGWLARKLLAPVHAALGGNIALAVSGGGSLPTEVDRLLLEVGVPFLNGYGLTETSPVLTVRIPSGNRVASIGPPLPGTELRIVRDGRVVDEAEVVGEIHARGPQIMRGYYRDDHATRAVLTNDGWLSTGDLGSRDADGWFRITGRIKDTIVLAGGENVEPEPIECRLKTSPWIDQAMLVGQDRKVIGALIVINPEVCERELGRFDPKDEALRERLRTEIDSLLTIEAGFRKIDRVGPFCVMDRAFSVDDGTMTATLKLRRHVIAEEHAAVIDSLYR